MAKKVAKKSSKATPSHYCVGDTFVHSDHNAGVHIRVVAVTSNSVSYTWHYSPGGVGEPPWKQPVSHSQFQTLLTDFGFTKQSCNKRRAALVDHIALAVCNAFNREVSNALSELTPVSPGLIEHDGAMIIMKDAVHAAIQRLTS